MLRCRVIHDPSGFQAMADAWDGLVRRSEFVDVCSTAGFARAWWRAYGNGRSLHLIVVEDESSLPRLIAPFYSDDSSPRRWSLIGTFRADYTNVIVAVGDAQALDCLFAWLRGHPGWRRLALRCVPGHAAVLQHLPYTYEADSPYWEKARSWAAVGWPLSYRRRQALHPRIAGERLRCLSDLLDRKGYRKDINWLRRQGTLGYQCISQPEEIQERLAEFRDLHIAEWESKGQRSLFLDAANCRFYEALTREMVGYGAIRLDVLTLNGRTIAAHFGFTWNRRVSYYKPCYAPAFASRSPGKLLLAHIIRRAVEEGAEEVDLLYGLEGYKQDYASDIRETASLVIHRSRWGALLARLGWREG